MEMEKFRSIYSKIVEFNSSSELMTRFYELTEEEQQDFYYEALKLADSEKTFIFNFFEKLNMEGITSFDGADAVNMYCIWRNANYHYPLFRQLGEQEKVIVLQKGFVKGYSIENLAVSTYDTFQEAGIDRVIWRFDPILAKYKILRKLGEHRFSRKNGDSCKPGDVIQCIDFYYTDVTGKIKFRTTLHISDMWDLLRLRTDPLAKFKKKN